MFKRMFQFSSTERETIEASPNACTDHSVKLVELSSAIRREAERSGNGAHNSITGVSPVCESFDQVYAKGGVPSNGRDYTIIKVADMLSSRHLSGMQPEAKRNSLMMALEAAEVEIGDLLQDAVARNRALDAYEEQRQMELKAFEDAKAEENNRLHDELEHLTGQYMCRIQANSDQVSQEQDNFRAWQKRKQQESQKITDAATVCVPQGNSHADGATSLTVMLERVNMARR